ncbi:hypothetical protein TNCV_5112731 [Trichonephila clavipes]|nr:hypothetical protein TNCV_5112731 [Trichonephila clavipes]
MDSCLACHEFETSTIEGPPCRGAMPVKFVESSNVLPLVRSVPEPDEIGNLIEEIVDFARQIHLEVDSGDVPELLDSLSQELTTNDLIAMHGQDIEELEPLDPVQSKD